MTKRRYSRKTDSLLEMAIRSQWQFAAIISAGVFIIAFLILPLFGLNDVIIHTLIGVFKPFLLIAGGVFALIALFNYFRQSQSGSKLSNPSIHRAIPASRSVSSPSSPSSFLQTKNTTGYSLREPQSINGGLKDDTQWCNPSVPSDPNEVQRPASWSIELLQQIEWKLFEDISAAYYKEKGIRAELTKLGADGGIDIKLFQDDSGMPTALVQCKAWNTKQVGVKPIREFLGVMSHEKIPKGFFMASGAYSQDAIEIAKANGITLVDGKMFLTMIQSLPAEAQQRLLDLATAGEYTTPSCPSCGVKMLRKSGKQGGRDFWGCLNFPRCRQTLHVKGRQAA